MKKITCDSCRALCCKLEVALIDDSDDAVPSEFTEKAFDGPIVMQRESDGYCKALNRSTFLCTIYDLRPFLCRDYQAGDDDCLEERKALPAPFLTK